FHHYDIMSNSGLDRVQAATVFVPVAVASAAANLLGGMLMDRIRPRYVLSLGQVMLAAALVLAALVNGSGSMLVYGALLGTAQGVSGAVKASAHAHYFGRKHIGAIKGFASTVSVAATAAGPLVVSLGLDAVGAYAPVLIACAVVPMALALLAPFLRVLRPDGGVV